MSKDTTETTEPTAKEIEDVLIKVGNMLTKREMEVLAWIAANVRLA